MIDSGEKITNEEVIIAGCIVRIRFANDPDPMTIQNMERILFDSGCIVQNTKEIC